MIKVRFGRKVAYLLNSRRDLVDSGVAPSDQERKWNWVTVLVSPVCVFFR